jgi:precorrin-2 dehydrogenase/sirohydrochlorin ferrochelatase
VKHLYSMWVDLTNKRCLVVGGGEVAERKISALLDASAIVTVVSPKFTLGINALLDEGRVQGICKKYESKDAEDAFLIIAATDVKAVNLNVFRDAAARNQLVNIVDEPGLSSFTNASTFSRGKLQISVSTLGASPSLARQICKDLEHQYGREYEVYLDFLHEYRMKVKENVSDPVHRQRLYKEMMQEDILHMIRTGEFETFRAQVLNRFGG